jgi:hypothetical protein
MHGASTEKKNENYTKNEHQRISQVLFCTHGAKPLFANQVEANEPGLSRRPAGRTSAPPPGANIGGPLYMN